MTKNFQDWHNQKKTVHDNGGRVNYGEREVWWCRIGLNVGFEQDGKGDLFSRPVLVLKGFSKETFLALPVTTKEKEGKYYKGIDFGDGIKRKVILSQLRLVDTKRLQNKIGMIPKENFQEIKKAITQMIE